jgi:TRAP-type C4-dicarboxylate transport system substrate-binding protein
MRRRAVLTSALAASAGLVAHAIAPRRASGQAAVTMRLSHQVPPAHHMSGLLESFARKVAAKTSNGVQVQIAGSEQLARAGENFPAVARGSIEAAMSVNFQWGNTIPEMSALTIPYLFTDLARNQRFATSDARRFLDAALERRAVKSLVWLYITRQSIFTSSRRPLISLADFQGVKIRGLNALTDNALSAVGAAPSAMPGSEVYQALQSGVLDAGLTDLSAAYSRRFYEVQRYGTVTPYFAVYFHMFCNPRWWSGLTEAQRTAISEAGREVEVEAVEVTERTAAEAVGQLREKGMQLHIQTDAEAAQWRAAMQRPVIEAFLRAAPEGGQRIIDLLNAIPTA